MSLTIGLPCPKCGYPESRVIYTRRREDKLVRRRECRRCKARVTTHERPVEIARSLPVELRSEPEMEILIECLPEELAALVATSRLQ